MRVGGAAYRNGIDLVESLKGIGRNIFRSGGNIACRVCCAAKCIGILNPADGVDVLPTRNRVGRAVLSGRPGVLINCRTARKGVDAAVARHYACRGINSERRGDPPALGRVEWVRKAVRDSGGQ